MYAQIILDCQTQTENESCEYCIENHNCQLQILNHNEQIVHSCKGNCEKHIKAKVQQKVTAGFKTKKPIQIKDFQSGKIVLTNQRLMWLEQRDMLTNTERPSLEISLKSIKGITCSGKIAKGVFVADRDNEYIFRLSNVGKKETESFRDLILRQIESA
jgi:hypothetical protein